MSYKFEFGSEGNFIDVTDLVYTKLLNSNMIEFKNINYNNLFGDPCYNIKKVLKITNTNDYSTYITEDHDFVLDLNIKINENDLDVIKQNIINETINYDEQPIYGIYFICCMGNYLEIVEEQINIILNSKLYHNSKEIICFICLYNKKDIILNNLLSKYSKFRLITTPLNLYEKYAINNYKNYIPEINSKYYIYYFHTKAVKYDKNHFNYKIRKILDFYTLNKYELSLKLLKYYDAVGVSLSRYPKMHFSGNFWWSTSEHVNKLSNVSDKYFAPEMYICSNPTGNYISLSQTTSDANLNNHILLNDKDIVNNLTTTFLENKSGINIDC